MFSIFLADDERWIIVGLKKLIEKSEQPFEVIGAAYDGVTTLEELEQKRPDILFTDIRMPGCDGLQLLERMAERQLETKVVIISGYAEFEYAQRAIRAGAVDYLLKPVEQERVNEVLGRLAERLSRERGLDPACIQEELPKLQPSVIAQIVKEIREGYTDNITLSSLAEKYGISVGHLSNLVKAEIGYSFSEYITAKRMQRAKELLADPALSISEVAEQSGYRDYFYFTKAFKKYMGISPSKYRKDL